MYEVLSIYLNSERFAVKYSYKFISIRIYGWKCKLKRTSCNTLGEGQQHSPDRAFHWTKLLLTISSCLQCISLIMIHLFCCLSGFHFIFLVLPCGMAVTFVLRLAMVSAWNLSEMISFRLISILFCNGSDMYSSVLII